MKRTRLFVASILALGLSGVAQASPFPADSSEESYNLPASDSYSDQHARLGDSSAWGVSKREMQQDTFPSGGGLVDD